VEGEGKINDGRGMVGETELGGRGRLGGNGGRLLQKGKGEEGRR